MNGEVHVCDWCGRAIRWNAGRWQAIKATERGYNPTACHESDDQLHDPKGPQPA